MVFPEGFEQEATSGGAGDGGHGRAEVVGRDDGRAVAMRHRIEEQEREGQFVGGPAEAGHELDAHQEPHVGGHQPQTGQRNDRQAAQVEEPERADS